MIKTCKWCGKEFEAKDNRNKYCSYDCTQEHFNKYQREYKRKNPPIAKKKAPLNERVCQNPECGKIFYSSRYNKIYCSDECRKACRYEQQSSYRQRRKNPQPAPEKTYPSKGIEYHLLSPEEKFFYGRTQEKAYADELRVTIPRGLTKVKYRDA